MEAILKLADQLGKAIADAQAADNLRTAREAMHADSETMDLLKDFMAKSAEFNERIQKQQPIEPADKHMMNDLQAAVAGKETFKTFNAAQVEYVDLMRRVSQTILTHLRTVDGPIAPPEEA